jgi:hypothetical protein
MPTFQKMCNIGQGYNLKKDIMTPVGYLTSVKIGDITLKADQKVKDPLAPETALQAVAVLSGVMWELGVTDTLYFSGQISVHNKQQILQLVYKGLTKVDVVFKFAVYSYDPLEKKYFKCLLGTDDSDLNGLLEKRGDELNLSVADDASPEVQSPENFAFQVGIKPQPSDQAVTVATSFSAKVVKAWGMEVGK